MMIEKIASHLGDFSPRLQSNTRALYQVRNIPVVDSFKFELTALKCEKIIVVTLSSSNNVLNILLTVLPDPSDFISTTGKRVVLQHLLFTSSMWYGQVFRLANQRTSKFDVFPCLQAWSKSQCRRYAQVSSSLIQCCGTECDKNISTTFWSVE